MDSNALQGLMDRNAIIDTLTRYATGIDSRDAEIYRSCFTEDLEVDVGGGAPGACGADAWVDQAFRAVGAFQSTQHIITNHVVTIDGDAATCVAYLQAQHFNPESSLLVGGYYTDRLVRVEEGWRIAKLKLTITWTQPWTATT
jgi:ketosteroid isomerase-like protein